MTKKNQCHIIEDDETRRIYFSCCDHCDHPGNYVDQHSWYCEECEDERIQQMERIFECCKHCEHPEQNPNLHNDPCESGCNGEICDHCLELVTDCMYP